MSLKNVSFFLSSPSFELCPQTEKKEIVLLGKSNVGKSTFINMLVGQTRLAFTSSTPGRTRLLNYFNVDDRFYLVDAPGYGYAKVSKSEDQLFERMMSDYLSLRENLAGAIFLLDSRRELSEDDIHLFRLLVLNEIPFILVATKCDKLNQSQRTKLKSNFFQTLNLEESYPLIRSSNTSRLWIDEVEAQIKNLLID